tara:strand:- start:570 stop:866 length:297 start_codon:yes stop_codon:yes gene_type:complete
MSRIDYKIDSIIPIGFSRAMVRYSVFEGEIAAQVEPVVNANGTTSNQSVTRYRRESRIAGPLDVNLPEDDAAMRRELNTLLQTYANDSRTAIDEQVNE